MNPCTFRIFDGIPAEDNPWAAFLEDDIESFDGDEIDTQSSEGKESVTEHYLKQRRSDDRSVELQLE